MARVNGRELDQCRNLIQQILIITEACFLALGLGLHLLVDFRLARCEVRDDMAVFAQLCLVLVRTAQTNRSRAHESVSVRGVAGGYAKHVAGNHVSAVHQHQSVHRAHELRVAVAPAHDLGNGEFFYDLIDDTRKNSIKFDAGHLEMSYNNFALRSLATLK